MKSNHLSEKRLGFVKNDAMVFLAAVIFSGAAFIFATPSTASVKAKVASLLSFLASGFIISFFINKKTEVHNLYLVFAIIFSIGYSFIIPFGQIPDEAAHYCRIFEISQGGLLTPVTSSGIGDYLPSDFFSMCGNYREAAAAFGKTIDYSNKEFVEFAGSALYSPLCYVPQTLAIMVLKLFTRNAGVVFGGTRLLTCAFCVTLFYLSIKLIPYGKMVLFAVAMLPMTLHQQISVSADGTTIALAVFAVSFVLYLCESATPLKKTYLFMLGAVLLILAMSKIVYLLFSFLVILLPKNKFKSGRIATLYKIAVPLAVVLLNIMWFRVTTRYFVEFREGVNIKEQIKFVMGDLYQYFRILCSTAYYNAESYLKMLGGCSLGWLDVPINFLGYGTALLVLLLTVFSCAGNKYSCTTKLFFIALTLGTLALTFSALYAQWTPVGEKTVYGIQGRYFIPLILPFACFAPQVTEYTDETAAYENTKKYMLFMLMMFANFITLTNCFYHFNK